MIAKLPENKIKGLALIPSETLFKGKKFPAQTFNKAVNPVHDFNTPDSLITFYA